MFDDVKKEDQASQNNPIPQDTNQAVTPTADSAVPQAPTSSATPQAPVTDTVVPAANASANLDQFAVNDNPQAVSPASPQPAQTGVQQPVTPVVPQAVNPAEQNIPTDPQAANKSSIDDMFGDVDPEPDQQSKAFDKPSAIAGGKLQPVQNTSLPASPQAVNPAEQVPNNINQILVEDSGKGSLLKKVIIALVGLVLVAVVAWAAYSFIFNTDKPVTENEEIINETEETPPPEEEEEYTPPPEEEENVDADDDDDGLSNAEEFILGTSPNNPDTDDDGLFDREEVKTYHTDPNNPDTDNDGLFDRTEVFIWETDPLNPDTDNDTYLDGVEVSNGYNPLGDGELPKKQEDLITE